MIFEQIEYESLTTIILYVYWLPTFEATWAQLALRAWPSLDTRGEEAVRESFSSVMSLAACSMKAVTWAGLEFSKPAAEIHFPVIGMFNSNVFSCMRCVNQW